MRALIVINPAASRVSTAEIKEILRFQFAPLSWQMEFYETIEEQPVKPVVREAIKAGVECVFAAGGDGTVSDVVDGLALTPVPLGIIPTGTSNVIAQELRIPQEIKKACELLSGQPRIMHMDAIEVGERFFVLAVGTGIDAMVMKSVTRENKRRYGRLAYVWSALKVIMGMQPRRFTIIADGKAFQTKASMVLISNVGTLTWPLRWGPGIRPDDGCIDVNIIRGRHLLDYLFAIYDLLPGGTRRAAHIRHIRAEEQIEVTADETLLVQGDGDLIGKTPLRARVIANAVRVFVPSDGST